MADSQSACISGSEARNFFFFFLLGRHGGLRQAPVGGGGDRVGGGGDDGGSGGDDGNSAGGRLGDGGGGEPAIESKRKRTAACFEESVLSPLAVFSHSRQNPPGSSRAFE